MKGDCIIIILFAATEILYKFLSKDYCPLKNEANYATNNNKNNAGFAFLDITQLLTN